MAEAYHVVFATRVGAQRSNHCDGTAVDLTAVGLPRQLSLVSPSGEAQVFDLSGPHETRDLSLSPALIAWIEAHYGLKKLKSDYPHWDDVQ
jgi:D-alanyl-D-alanine dipeptidase